jgi:hypothetical protein
MSRTFLTHLAVASVILSIGCASAATRPTVSDSQLALLRADSAAFETVVRMELSGSEKAHDYPYKIDPLRVDSRPDGQVSAFHDVAGGTTGSVAGPDSARDSVTMTLVSRQRKVILKNLGVQEGGPFKYSQCGGTLDPRLAPSADCPKENHYYVTIGLPSLGIPPGLRIRVGPKDKPPDLSGEIWTVVVTEAYAGSRGQSWFQHAWLLRRDPVDRRLKLAHTELLSWAE